jgi:hypothetical protein
MQSNIKKNYTPNLPIKPIKNIIKKYYKGEISEDACYFVRDNLVKLTELFAQEAIREFEKTNDARQKHGIPILKRLDKKSFVYILDSFLIRIDIPVMGKVGQDNTSLLCQNGAKNE